MAAVNGLLGLHVLYTHRPIDGSGMYNSLTRGRCSSHSAQYAVSYSGSWGDLSGSLSLLPNTNDTDSGVDQPILDYSTFAAFCYANMAALLLGARTHG